MGKNEQLNNVILFGMNQEKKGTLIYCPSETIKTTLKNNLALPGKL